MAGYEYGELKHRLWALWHHTADLISKYEESGFRRDAGLSHQQYLILHTMIYLNQPSTATDIAGRIEKNTNSVSTMLDRMEKNGLVRKVRDLSDRRLVRLTITEKGTEKLTEAMNVGWRLMEELMSSYSDEELNILACELGRLRNTVFQKLYPEQSPYEISDEDFSNKIHLFKEV
jgi:DNA-binding MarR family transcriptional regulator